MDQAAFQDTLKRSPTPVVVDFWAPWCVPCRSIAHTLQALETEYNGQVSVLRVNVDDSPGLARALDVLAIPTLMVFRDGRSISRTVGAQSPGNLRRLFEAALDGKPPRMQLAAVDRFLRLGIGAVLAAVGLSIPGGWWLVMVAGVVMFTGVYDRCPIWQALAPRLAALFRR